MGQEFQLVRLGRTATLPLVSKDTSMFLVSAVQPVTPLLRVQQAVRFARADERIAEFKAQAAAAQVASDVEHAYLSLLIAEREQEVARIKVDEMMASGNAVTQVSTAAPSAEGSAMEAAKALVIANSKVAEQRAAMNALLGYPAEARLDLSDPPPLIEDTTSDSPALAVDKNPDVLVAQEEVVKAKAATRLAKLEYVPEVAGTWGYMNQTVIPALPHDFSFVGLMASWTVFDFGKRERLIRERETQVKMAQTNVDLVRMKVAASVQKASLDLQRARRIMQLTRQVASMARMMPAASTANSQARAAAAHAELEMYQAELEYRMAYTEMKRARRTIQ